MEKEYRMNQVRYNELQKELEYLRTTRRAEVEKKIQEARALGDLSENMKYDEAKVEQRDLKARIEEVEKILQQAVIEEEPAEDESTEDDRPNGVSE